MAQRSGTSWHRLIPVAEVLAVAAMVAVAEVKSVAVAVGSGVVAKEINQGISSVTKDSLRWTVRNTGEWDR